MTTLSYAAEQVRRYDHDRFLTVIFAPASVREHLFALYAFNLEIAKIGEIVTEPLIGQIRLQWWRDALDRLFAGGELAHEVARALGTAIHERKLDRAAFDRLIDSREFDLDREPPASMTALLEYAEGTGAPLLELALSICASGMGDAMVEPARLLGTAWALTGLLRAVPFHARQRRIYLPADEMAAADVKRSQLLEEQPGPGLRRIAGSIAAEAGDLLRNARPMFRAIPKAARSPLLLAPLTETYLADLRRADWNPFVLERRGGHPLMVARLALASIRLPC